MASSLLLGLFRCMSRSTRKMATIQGLLSIENDLLQREDIVHDDCIPRSQSTDALWWTERCN